MVARGDMKSPVGRNDPCPCGSGKKFKKCCENNALGGHKATVISSSSQNSLLGKITAAGMSFSASKEESTVTRVLHATIQGQSAKPTEEKAEQKSPPSEVAETKTEPQQEKD